MISVNQSANLLIQSNQLTLLTSNEKNPLAFIVPIPDSKSVNILKMIRNVVSYINGQVLVGSSELMYLVYNEQAQVVSGADADGDENIGKNDDDSQQIKITPKNAKQISEALKLTLIKSENVSSSSPQDQEYQKIQINPTFLFTTLYDDFATNFKIISKSEKFSNVWQMFYNFSDKLSASRKLPVVCVSEFDSESSILADFDRVRKNLGVATATKSKQRTLTRTFYKISQTNDPDSKTIAIISSQNSTEDAIEEFNEFFDNVYAFESFVPGQASNKLAKKMSGQLGLGDNLGDIDRNLIYIGVLMVILAFFFGKLMYT